MEETITNRNKSLIRHGGKLEEPYTHIFDSFYVYCEKLCGYVVPILKYLISNEYVDKYCMN